MLESIRNAASSIWFRAFLFILAISFAVMWSIGDMIMLGGRTPSRALISVGSTKVGVGEFQRKLKQELIRFQAEMGQGFSPEMLQQPEIMQMVVQRTLQTLVQGELIRQEADRLGVVVSDEIVREKIQAMPLFQRDGKYSQQALKSMLRNFGLTDDDFVAQVRQEIQQRLLIQPLFGAIESPPFMTAQLYKWQKQNRTLKLIQYKDADMNKFSDPLKLPQKEWDGLQEQWKTYYETHQEDFRVPEVRKISVMVLDASSVDMNPTDDELRPLFEEQKKEDKKLVFAKVKNNLRKQYKLKHGADQLYELSNVIKDKLAGGATFAEVAKDHKLKILTSTFNVTETPDELRLALGEEEAVSLKQTSLELHTDDLPQEVMGEQGEIFFVRVDDIKESHVLPYDAKEVGKKWAKREQKKLNQDRVSEKMMAFEKNKAAFDAEYKARKGREVSLMRTEARKIKLPSFVVQAAFEKKKGEYFMARDASGSIMLGRVEKVSEPRVDTQEKGYQAIKGGVGQMLQADFLNLLLRNLEYRYKVEINQPMLQQILESGMTV